MTVSHDIVRENCDLRLCRRFEEGPRGDQSTVSLCSHTKFGSGQSSCIATVSSSLSYWNWITDGYTSRGNNRAECKFRWTDYNRWYNWKIGYGHGQNAVKNAVMARVQWWKTQSVCCCLFTSHLIVKSLLMTGLVEIPVSVLNRLVFQAYDKWEQWFPSEAKNVYSILLDKIVKVSPVWVRQLNCGNTSTKPPTF